MAHTRIIWADCDDDGRVLDPSPRPLRVTRWICLVALLTLAAWAFVQAPW
jgi:hypothetical protein